MCVVLLVIFKKLVTILGVYLNADAVLIQI